MTHLAGDESRLRVLAWRRIIVYSSGTRTGTRCRPQSLAARGDHLNELLSLV
jgi:hypothetical protein